MNDRIDSLAAIGRLLCLLATLCAASNCSAQDNRGTASTVPLNYELNTTTSTIGYPIASARKVPAKFVRVTLGSIANPTRASLTFEVFFRPENKERFLLGSFSPYPADNPGVFIVPTQGKVFGKGIIDVSMTAADNTPVGALNVRITSIELVDN